MEIINKDFELLLEGCKNSVERFVYYRIPAKEDAEDILQEVFLIIFKKFDTIQDKNKFKSWVLSIASNKCHDYFRKKFSLLEVPLDDFYSHALCSDKTGITLQEIVNETFENISFNDRQVFYQFYLKEISQKDIAAKLGIPIGTVKSRLNKARLNFKEKYPYPPNIKGEITMSKTTFPDILPEITITKMDSPIFPILFEELPGWFIIPRIGEKNTWAIYDYPAKTCSELTTCEVVGEAQIHGVSCVEIQCNNNRTLYAKLSDTHVQYVAEIHHLNDVKIVSSFLDDDWLKNWSYGEDNCGREIQLTSDSSNIEGVYEVTVGSTTYITLKLIDTNTEGIYLETYIDKSGRTVLWRRYNSNDWKVDSNGYYKIPWIAKLPDNETITINDTIYVHWYDCISSYVL